MDNKREIQRKMKAKRNKMLSMVVHILYGITAEIKNTFPYNAHYLKLHTQMNQQKKFFSC